MIKNIGITEQCGDKIYFFLETKVAYLLGHATVKDGNVFDIFISVECNVRIFLELGEPIPDIKNEDTVVNIYSRKIARNVEKFLEGKKHIFK